MLAHLKMTTTRYAEERLPGPAGYIQMMERQSVGDALVQARGHL